jgi:hypothetical protein
MILRAGIIYGLIIFGLGFLLGTLRVLLIAPQLGEAMAVIVELPIMLLACWLAAGWTVRRYRPATRDAALLIGVVGFAVLMLGELAVALTLFGLTPAGWIASFGMPTAQLGLIAQLIAVAFPLIHARRLPRA